MPEIQSFVKSKGDLGLWVTAFAVGVDAPIDLDGQKKPSALLEGSGQLGHAAMLACSMHSRGSGADPQGHPCDQSDGGLFPSHELDQRSRHDTMKFHAGGAMGLAAKTTLLPAIEPVASSNA
jgi:hypothetical protein